MRIFDSLFDPQFSTYTLPFLGFALLLLSPGLLKGARSDAHLLAGLLVAGAIARYPRLDVPGVGLFCLSAIPAITILIGWRAAIAAAAMYALIEIGLTGSERGAGIDFILNGFVMATVSLISFHGFHQRFGFQRKSLAAGLSAWFGVLAVAVSAAFFVPIMGRALWGVFAPAISTAAIWMGAIEGLFTAVLVTWAEARRRAPGLPEQAQPASDEVVTSRENL